MSYNDVVKLNDRVLMTDPDYRGLNGTITECEQETYDGNIEVTLDDGSILNFPILNWNQERNAEHLDPVPVTYEAYIDIFEKVTV